MSHRPANFEDEESRPANLLEGLYVESAIKV